MLCTLTHSRRQSQCGLFMYVCICIFITFLGDMVDSLFLFCVVSGDSHIRDEGSSTYIVQWSFATLVLPSVWAPIPGHVGQADCRGRFASAGCLDLAADLLCVAAVTRIHRTWKEAHRAVRETADRSEALSSADKLR